ncbi:MAG: ComF family protein [Candidatus Gracilibacteria bacterium]
MQCGFLSEALCGRCFYEVEFRPHVRDLEGLRVCSALFYEEKSIVGRLIRPFKYSHQADLFRIFVPWMKEALRLLGVGEKVIFMPVPLHKSRELERGYNQAELLAKWIAKDWGCPVMNVVRRVKDTGSQAKLADRKSRKENMQGAFEVDKGRLGFAEEGYPIVLVDDIVTTGSTLLACAQALRAAGAEHVFALTLADREKKTCARDGRFAKYSRQAYGRGAI